MIALRDSLPLIRHAGGYVSAFEREWLRRSLVEAARKAGHADWWLADHVLESIVRYLEDQFDGSELSVRHLGRAVRTVLHGIGHGNVAEHFDPIPPPRRVCLTELAARAGAGYELAFFGLLGTELDTLAALGVRTIRLEGLEPCVKRLRAAKAWRADCRTLQADIVGFVRDRLARAHPDTLPGSAPLTLTLC